MLVALTDVDGAKITFSPGFRWVTSLLAGQAVMRHQLMNQTAVTYFLASFPDKFIKRLRRCLKTWRSVQSEPHDL